MEVPFHIKMEVSFHIKWKFLFIENGSLFSYKMEVSLHRDMKFYLFCLQDIYLFFFALALEIVLAVVIAAGIKKHHIFSYSIL